MDDNKWKSKVTVFDDNVLNLDIIYNKLYPVNGSILILLLTQIELSGQMQGSSGVGAL